MLPIYCSPRGKFAFILQCGQESNSMTYSPLNRMFSPAVRNNENEKKIECLNRMYSRLENVPLISVEL